MKNKILLWIINNFLSGTRFFFLKRKLLIYLGVKVGKNTKIVGPLDFGNSISIEIGDNCWIGKNISFDGNGSIIIKNNVDVAPHVVMNTGGHIIGNSLHRAGDGINTSIIIGDGTWIGTRATIIGDSEIGSGVVVAAGTLVRSDFPNNVLIAGLPAKIKKNLS